MIQPTWRFLCFQGDSALAKWYQARTETETAQCTRKTMIVALARKPPGGIGAIVRREGLYPHQSRGRHCRLHQNRNVKSRPRIPIGDRHAR
jgi:hypothetical protein